MLALLWKAFGPGAYAVPRFVLNAFVVGLMYALLPWASVRLGFGLGTGMAAGIGGALLPVHFLQELRGADAAPTAVFMIAGTVWIGAGWFEQSRARAIVTGIVCGIGILVNSALLAVFLALSCGRVLVTGERNRTIRRAAVALAVAILTMLPWAVRNRVALGEWIWTRTNFGLEFYQSNNPAATSNWFERMPAAAVHPVWNPEVRRYFARVGEVTNT